jgi:retron-type reverse transcriptase
MKKLRRTYNRDQSPLFKLGNKRKLASLLGICLHELKALHRADALYRETEVPKKNGGVRRIENPRRHLKIVQARIARYLGRISAPSYLFCPVKGRSYVDNAAKHVAHRVVRTLDIKKYFPNTSRNRVYRFFSQVMKCSPDVADLLTDIATYKGHLPTGSPLSPIMAFYAHLEVWDEVNRIAQSSGATNSLYIDDLTISGTKVSKRIMWEVKKTIHRSGLRYHKEKIFRDRPAEVTGVIIRGDKLIVPNRQMLKRHRAEQAIQAAQTENERQLIATQLNGLRAQIDQIESLNAKISPKRA